MTATDRQVYIAMKERRKGKTQEQAADDTEEEEGLDEDVIPEEFKKRIEKLDDKKYNVAIYGYRRGA